VDSLRRMGGSRPTLLAAFAALSLCVTMARAEVEVLVTYLRVAVEAPPVLSNLDPVPDDLGIAGARVGWRTTRPPGAFWAMPSAGRGRGAGRRGPVASRARRPCGIALRDLGRTRRRTTGHRGYGRGAGGHPVQRLGPRCGACAQADCRANVLHTLPSNAMRTDALAQFLVKRQWDRLALIAGTHPQDTAYAERRCARASTKFGLRLRAEKTWAFDADMRRNAAQEVPLFTQALGDYDVLLVADEIHDFGRYIAYNTWDPRPVAGSEGLARRWPGRAWSSNGARRSCNRASPRPSGRDMRPKDYAAWAAMRAIGEAVTRTNGGRRRHAARLHARPGVRAGGLQGPSADLPRLERPAAPAHPAGAAARAGGAGPARGVPAPTHRTRHAGPRRARKRTCTAFD
jgi:hypothetical protein